MAVEKSPACAFAVRGARRPVAVKDAKTSSAPERKASKVRITPVLNLTVRALDGALRRLETTPLAVAAAGACVRRPAGGHHDLLDRLHRLAHVRDSTADQPSLLRAAPD